MDIAKGEWVEGELDAFINRKDKQRRETEGRPPEELYAESCRRHAEREQLQCRWAWLRFHERMIAAHTATYRANLAHHRAEAERHAEALGVEAIDETTKGNGHKRGD